MSDMMRVSSNPHIRSKVSTDKIMLMVIIALLPATGFGIYNFGIRALFHVLITIASCVLSVRRTGTELYESGTCCQMLPVDILPKSDD